MSKNGGKTYKPYRIEGNAPKSAAVLEADPAAEARHADIMTALRLLRDMLEPTKDASSALLEEFRKDMFEARRLKTEMDSITDAIGKTKQEIATIHYAGAQGREISKATDELGAVVNATETATNSLLEHAEAIDEIGSNLAARLTGDDKALAQQLNDHVMGIFQACNFQDITGQRITKVVETVRFIEKRVGQMIEIWGGIESFKNVSPLEDENRKGDRALLNGPALEGEGLSGQDLIDALLNGDASSSSGPSAQSDIDALFD